MRQKNESLDRSGRVSNSPHRPSASPPAPPPPSGWSSSPSTSKTGSQMPRGDATDAGGRSRQSGCGDAAAGKSSASLPLRSDQPSRVSAVGSSRGSRGRPSQTGASGPPPQRAGGPSASPTGGTSTLTTARRLAGRRGAGGGDDAAASHDADHPRVRGDMSSAVARADTARWPRPAGVAGGRGGASPSTLDRCAT